MSTVDSRLEEFRSQFRGSSGSSTGLLGPPSAPPPITEMGAGGNELATALRFMKMEIPKFNRTDPHGWVFRVEEFFDFHGTPEPLRLRIVSFHMEGPAADHQGNLSKLTQTATVAEFQLAFEDLMNKVTGISEPLLISFFITGLKSDIRRELLFSRPSTLMEAFALARAYETRCEEIKQSARPWHKWSSSNAANTSTVSSTRQHVVTAVPTGPFQTTTPAPASPPTTIGHKQTPPIAPAPALPIRRLTPTELREKREKGLCYNCDKKYSANHRCRSKFLLLLGTDDIDEDIDEDGVATEPTEDLVTGDISSLNALAGQGNPRSLRLVGEFGSHRFHVLIDSGPDVVLGIQWLQQLGRVAHDYAALSMEFCWEGRPIILHGDLHQSSSLITFNQFQALIHSSNVHSMFALQPLATEELKTASLVTKENTLIFPNTLPVAISTTLQKFRDLFLPPTGLPPHRTIDHKIHLIPNSKPMNVRPYRYPHFQKNEMEKLIREMLDQVTIKDKFPIPTIDELLDELGGATIFSKLDLWAGYHQIRVLTCLHKGSFYVKLSKCHFCQETIEYLGHIVSAGGHLRGFLGLIGYYRRFIHGYASIAAPLTDLLRKDAFNWTPEVTVAFDALKSAMVAAPVLRLPDFNETFVIKTDASNVGIGAVLMQAGHPISYFSKKLGPRLQASSTYLKELHAIAEAVHKWRQYLLGRFFIIRTDHKSIKELLQQVVQTPDQQIYIRKLLGYHFRIEYKPGHANQAADALSRVHEEELEQPALSAPSCLSFSSHPSLEFLTTLRQENSTLSDLVSLHQQFTTGSLSSAYSLHDGLLFFKHRYYISPNSSLKALLLHEFHATPFAGHGGVKRTLVRLATLFYWPRMRADVEQYVSACLVCQQTKYSTQAPAGLLQPLPVPSLVWNEVTMDFITNLPPSRNFTVIMVVVNRLTKSAHFGALPTQFTAAKSAEVFAAIVVKIHGFPSSIISDRDPVFMSKFWQTLFQLSRTSLRHSTAYHPQTDGQSEVVNRGLEQYLRAFTNEKPHSWISFLGWAEFCYNSSYLSGLKMTPFQALFGRPPPIIPAYTQGSTSIQALDEALVERDALLRTLKKNLRQAQHRMTQKANAHRRDLQLEVGDMVLVRLQPYRQPTAAYRPYQKLAKRFYGPYQVLERIGAVAYRLALPSGCKIHPVFHISALKPFRGPVPDEVYPLPTETMGIHPLLVPAAICAVRTILRQGKEVQQILVQWTASDPENATWEDFVVFCRLYPDYHLEDKVDFMEWGMIHSWPFLYSNMYRQLKHPLWKSLMHLKYLPQKSSMLPLS
ncbi:Transposon Tf2-12 polyprotein [Vitis vinifera]|uniref:Transposon Tf2-12 polyprotein n=1 Tax=Vitis vinifera TaxID=29760 RepID=A0A438GFZ7_VITVI|nr:Transposon Tf2-12 polyprotein [Vitis vinifera]